MPSRNRGDLDLSDMMDFISDPDSVLNNKYIRKTMKDINNNTKRTADATSGIKDVAEETMSNEARAEAEMKNKVGSKAASTAGAAFNSKSDMMDEDSLLNRMPKLKNIFNYVKGLGVGAAGLLTSGAALKIAGIGGVIYAGMLTYKAGKMAIELMNINTDNRGAADRIETQRLNLQQRKILSGAGYNTRAEFSQAIKTAQESGSIPSNINKAKIDVSRALNRSSTMSELEDKYQIDVTNQEYATWKDNLLNSNITERQFFDRIQNGLPQILNKNGMQPHIKSWLNTDLPALYEKNTNRTRGIKVLENKSTNEIINDAKLAFDSVQQKALETSSNADIANSIYSVGASIREFTKTQKDKIVLQTTLPPRPAWGLTTSINQAMT